MPAEYNQPCSIDEVQFSDTLNYNQLLQLLSSNLNLEGGPTAAAAATADKQYPTHVLQDVFHMPATFGTSSLEFRDFKYLKPLEILEQDTILESSIKLVDFLQNFFRICVSCSGNENEVLLKLHFFMQGRAESMNEFMRSSKINNTPVTVKNYLTELASMFYCDSVFRAESWIQKPKSKPKHYTHKEWSYKLLKYSRLAQYELDCGSMRNDNDNDNVEVLSLEKARCAHFKNFTKNEKVLIYKRNLIRKYIFLPKLTYLEEVSELDHHCRYITVRNK